MGYTEGFCEKYIWRRFGNSRDGAGGAGIPRTNARTTRRAIMEQRHQKLVRGPVKPSAAWSSGHEGRGGVGLMSFMAVVV